MFLLFFFVIIFRLDTREKYIRSKSPNMLNRKTIEVSSPAINNKSNVVNKEVQQRARTASMPGENRKVSIHYLLYFITVVECYDKGSKVRIEGWKHDNLHYYSTGGLYIIYDNVYTFGNKSASCML